MAGQQQQGQGRENGLDASVIVEYPIVVVFGKPGAGKTTVANAAIAKLEDNERTSTTEPSSVDPTDQTQQQQQYLLKCLGLDLDVCVPQWMRDNFANGIYPTLAQRQEFALTCCDHVEEQVREYNSTQQQLLLLGKDTISAAATATDSSSSITQEGVATAVVVAFSFVNTDLRDTFRLRFPNAAWVLIDTDDEEAMYRINQRAGHFYKGKQQQQQQRQQNSNESEEDDEPPPPPNATLPPPDTTKQQDEKKSNNTLDNNDNDNNNNNNSDWTFAPVTFPHVVLNGKNSIESNALKVVEVLWETSSKYNKNKNNKST